MRKTVDMLVNLALLVVMGACSVREDRSPCPCWLGVVFTSFPTEGVSLSGYTSRIIFVESVRVDPQGESYDIVVPRSEVVVTAVRDMPGLHLDGSRVVIPVGCQADSLYAHLSRVDCTRESARDTVTLHKQFATIYLDFVNVPGSEEVYSPRVKGCIAGVDLVELSLIEGEFSYEPPAVSAFHYQFRVPRQEDESLSLELTKTGTLQRVEQVAIGRLITQSGFDWTAPDLNDIVITIDFAQVDLKVSVSEWEAENIYNVTI